MDQEKIGQFIALLRKEQGMTQKELAQKLDVSDKTISKWETGRGLPEISIMQSLCKILNVSINELLSGDRLDTEAYRKKAEENLTVLMKRKNYKQVIIHMVISTVLCLLPFLTFILVAEKIESPLIVPVAFFWSILLVVANFFTGITYGIVKKWGKGKTVCVVLYNVLLLWVLITVLAMSTIIVSVL